MIKFNVSENQFGNLEKIFIVERTERKKIKDIINNYKQGSIVCIGGANKYKVYHCSLMFYNNFLKKIKNWDKKIYKIEFKSYITR